MPKVSDRNFMWEQVDTVLLDMDGTLLDRHFDNYFFEEALPARYAAVHGMEVDEAQRLLFGLYRSVEGTLEWADLSYWTHRLEVDVEGLTRELDHMIEFLPDAREFLSWLQTCQKDVIVVTNAHPSNLAIKTAKTDLRTYVNGIVHAFECGSLKMHEPFWSACRRMVNFDPMRTLYIDDDEGCLRAAKAFGVRYVVHRSRSSSRLPPEPSVRFPAIESFQELMGNDRRESPGLLSEEQKS